MRPLAAVSGAAYALLARLQRNVRDLNYRAVREWSISRIWATIRNTTCNALANRRPQFPRLLIRLATAVSRESGTLYAPISR